MLEQFFGVPFTLLSFVVVLTIVVFVHEFGHFYIARKNGVRCQAFSIGFGPELFGFTDKYGTRWKFSLVPLGGYVKMFGEGETMQVVEGGATDPVTRPLTPEEKAVSFKHKRVGQRAAIVFAGPAINFIFGILVFWVMFMTLGRPVTEPVVGQVVEGSAAAEAGVLTGDRIKSINGNEINRFEDILTTVLLSDGSTMELVMERDGAARKVMITPRQTEEDMGMGKPQKRYKLGIGAANTGATVVLNPVEALGASVGFTYDMVEGSLVAMGQIITGRRGTEDLGGPIRIAQFSGQAAKSGGLNFIHFIAILSINLGLINLFPVPMLDGGHLLFYAIEAVRGRPLSERVHEWGLRVGLALVMALMVFGAWNDIIHL